MLIFITTVIRINKCVIDDEVVALIIPNFGACKCIKLYESNHGLCFYKSYANLPNCFL